MCRSCRAHSRWARCKAPAAERRYICGGLNSIGTAPSADLKPERGVDEELSYGHTWSGDSITQLQLYNVNVYDKLYSTHRSALADRNRRYQSDATSRPPMHCSPTDMRRRQLHARRHRYGQRRHAAGAGRRPFRALARGSPLLYRLRLGVDVERAQKCTAAVVAVESDRHHQQSNQGCSAAHRQVSHSTAPSVSSKRGTRSIRSRPTTPRICQHTTTATSRSARRSRTSGYSRSRCSICSTSGPTSQDSSAKACRRRSTATRRQARIRRSSVRLQPNSSACRTGDLFQPRFSEMIR